jgi:translation elongation factor P/translation initiation factor 5A
MTSLAAKKLGVGLRQPYRGKTCGGMLGALARIVPARRVTPPNGQWQYFRISVEKMKSQRKREEAMQSDARICNLA